MKEWREKNGIDRPLLRDMPPEERQEKRTEIKERMVKRMEELRKKKADGSITEQETRMLQRMETMAKRVQEGGPGIGIGKPGGPPGDMPPGRRPPGPPAGK